MTLTGTVEGMYLASLMVQVLQLRALEDGWITSKTYVLGNPDQSLAAELRRLKVSLNYICKLIKNEKALPRACGVP